jgi:hypothetical protein
MRNLHNNNTRNDEIQICRWFIVRLLDYYKTQLQVQAYLLPTHHTI